MYFGEYQIRKTMGMCQNTTPLFASIHYAPYGGPKGGRPVVEERHRDNDQGGTLCRVARECKNTTPLFASIHYAPYGAGRSMLRPYRTPPFG